MTFLCYEKCSTCKKAEKWLSENHLEFQKRSITEEKPTSQELLEWKEKSGLPLERFCNATGTLYRESRLGERRKTMTEAELAEALAENGMLVKRPLLVCEDTVLVGFKESQWEAILLKEKKNNG